MGNNKLKVVIEDAREVFVDYKTTAVSAVSLVEKDLSKILAFKINNEIKAYDYNLVTDSTIEFVRFNSPTGYRVYTSTLKLILYMALTKLYSNTKVDFISTINRDQYFTIEGMDLTPQKVDAIKKEMNDIIKKDFPITKKQVPLEEATVLYKASNSEDKLENLGNKIKSYVTMYFCEGMYNYFYGQLAPSTGYINEFEILPYKDGALLIVPDNNMEMKVEVKENRLYETFIEFNNLNDTIGIHNIGNLNNKILKNQINDVIQVSEAIHEKELMGLLYGIEKRKEIKMVLIAGPSSSGKTTFAQKLGVGLRLSGYNPITISMDNYFKEREDTPIGEDGKYNFECVEALDIELFNGQMKDLIEGRTVELPEFDFLVGIKKYKGKMLTLGPKDILIIEGIHALNPILTEFTPAESKYKVYIAPITTLNIDGYTKVSSSDTRLIRRIVRDYSTRGHSVEKTFDLWANVKKGEEQYIFPFINDADYIYNSSLIYESSVMKTFVQPLLLQVEKTSEFYFEARRLYEYLNNFLPMETTNIPINSIIREFIGNGCFYR